MKKHSLALSLIFLSTTLSARSNGVEKSFADEFYGVVKQMEEGFASMASRMQNTFGGMFDDLKHRVQELDDKYIIKVEMPGIKKEDVTIKFDDNENSLFVKASVKEAEEVRDKKMFKKSEKYVSREAYVRLAKPVDGAKIKASYDHGLLTITVPKKMVQKETKDRREIVIGD